MQNKASFPSPFPLAVGSEINQSCLPYNYYLIYYTNSMFVAHAILEINVTSIVVSKQTDLTEILHQLS